MKTTYLRHLILSLLLLGCSGMVTEVSNPHGKTVNIIYNEKLVEAVVSNDTVIIDKLLNSKNVHSFYVAGLFEMIGSSAKGISHMASGDVGALANMDEGNDNLTLIIIASKYGYYDTVVKLLEYGASPDSWSVGQYRYKMNTNAISEALFNNHLNIVELLLLNDANPNKHTEKWNMSVSEVLTKKLHTVGLAEDEERVYALVKKFK